MFSRHNIGRIPMLTSVDVNEPSASVTSPTSFLRPQGWTRAEEETAAVIGLLIAVGLVLFGVANIYLNALVSPTDLPFLGQFFGS